MEQKGESSYFTRWTWVGTWLRCLPAQLRPRVLIATQGGEAVAAAILVARRERRHAILNVRQLHFNSTGDPALDCITIEYNDFVGASDPVLWQAFLRWFAAGEADELLLPGHSGDAPGRLASEKGLLHTERRQFGFICNLGEKSRQAGLSRNTRQQLRRSLRDCEELGELRIEAAGDVTAALAWFDAMKVFHVRSWARRGKRHAFYFPFFERFHRAHIQTGAGDGSVQMRRVTAGGNVLGYLYDFCHDGRVCAYQSGFDADCIRLRPGYVSHALAMEQCARQGARSYDFLAGENRLKRSLAANTYTLGWHRFGRPTAALRFEAIAARTISPLRADRRNDRSASVPAR